MARFLLDSDYDTLIKEEIRRLLDGRSVDGTGTPVKLLKAEGMAERQIRNWLSDRYDCDKIFSAVQEPTDERDAYIVMIMIDLALYTLYSQTGQRDVPEHRSQRYADALDWLKNAGRGQIGTGLPGYDEEEGGGSVPDLRLSSDKQENHIY